MPFAFLSPLLLGAAALIAVPWILHHIRRPEREPVRFSSLLFVPDVKREVIERRRLQHLLLMLLRMLLLFLIVWALARPYIPQLAGAVEREGGTHHVLLLDTSFSMGDAARFETAQSAAREVVDALEAEDVIAVVTFDEIVRAAVEFGDKAEARLAIETAKPTLAGTDYEAALRAAARLLTDNGLALEEGGQVVHLVTDFQNSGMPVEHSGWKLPAAIDFHPIDIGNAPGAWTVQEVDLRTFGKERFELRAKLRNWSGVEAPAQVRLVVNGEEVEVQSVEAAPGNASLVRFDFPREAATRVEGYVEVVGEDAPPAARRNFAWNPERKTHLVVPAVANDPRRWPPAVLLAHALPDTADTPWAVEVSDTPAADAIEADTVPIVAQRGSLTPETAAAIVAHVETGGKALIIVDAEVDDVTRTEVLAPLGIQVDAPRYTEISPARFALLSWVDFSDRVFRPFQGARFNDFSDIHFQNHQILRAEGDFQVVARFEADGETDAEGPPAIIDLNHGEGRVLIWAFPLDFAWTNLPKTPRFVPILHESIAALIAGAELNRAWEIGQRPAPPVSGWEAVFVSPEGDESDFVGPLVSFTGHLRWRDADTEELLQSEAVNVDAEEADPERVSPAEFALRLCSAAIMTESVEEADALTLEEENPVDPWEFGRYMLAAILAALALETWYAGRLT